VRTFRDAGLLRNYCLMSYYRIKKVIRMVSEVNSFLIKISVFFCDRFNNRSEMIGEVIGYIRLLGLFALK